MASDIAVRLGLEGLANVRSGLRQLDAELSGLSKSAGILSQGLSAIAPALASGLSVAGAVAFTRSTINAIDSMNDLVDATGSTIEKISALDEVARRNGNTLDQVGGILIKFNQALAAADGKNGVSKALQAIGVEAEALRRMDPADALRTVAQALSGFADDANKARIIQELFGKSIRDAAPLLRDIVEAGNQYGTVTAESAAQAEKFNKQLAALTTNFTNLGRSYVIEALPALNSYLEKLNSINRQGGVLGIIKSGEAWAAIKREVQSNLLVDYLDRQVAIVESLTKQLNENPGDNWTAKRLKEARDEAERLSRELNSVNEAQKEWAQKAKPVPVPPNAGGGRGFVNPEIVKPQLPDLAGSALADAAAQAYANLISGIRQKMRATDEEMAQMAPLTDAQRQLIQVQEDVRAGKLKLSAAELAYVETLLRSLDQKQRGLDADKDATKAIVDGARQRSAARNAEYDGIDEWLRKEQQARQASIDAVEERVRQLADEAKVLDVARRQNISLAEAVEQVAIARLREKQANYTEGSEPWQAVEREIQARQKLLDRMDGQRAQAQADDQAQRALESWKRVSAGIEDVLTAALIDGGEAGRDALERMFANMVLRPVVSAVLQPVSNSITGMLMGPQAGPNGQTSYVGNAFSSFAGNMFGATALGSFGTSMGAGLSMAANGVGFGTAMSSAGAQIGVGSYAAGFGQAIGYAMPYIAAAMAIYSIIKSMDDSGTPHAGAAVFADQLGSRLATGNELAFDVTPNADIEKSLQTMASSTVGMLNSIGAQFGGGSYGLGLGFADDSSSDASWGALRVTRDGRQVLDWSARDTDKWPGLSFADGQAGFTEYLAAVGKDLRSVLEGMDLPGWARDTLDELGSEPTLDALMQASMTITQVNGAIHSLQVAFSPLGSVLSSISDLSSDAVYELGQFAGGLDALGQSLAGYVQNYYSRDEIAGIQASELVTQLRGVGFTDEQLSGLSSREGYRGLVESLDASTEDGRRQLAALLTAQGTFAGLADYMGQTGSTLGLTADLSPSSFRLLDVAGAQSQAADVDRQVTATNEVRDSVDALGPVMQDIVTAVRGINLQVTVAPGYEVQSPV